MRTLLAIVAVSTLFLSAACRDREAMKRSQQQYEVVHEGAGGAVTGTIHGPGETPPPLMPALTGTNADTTTAFTLPSTMGATDTSAGVPGTIAGMLSTAPSPPPASTGIPQQPTSVQRPRQESPTPTPAPQPRPPVPPPPTTTTEEPPPATTQEPEQPEQPEPEPEEPEPKPDPPPPPPTTTDP